MLADHLLNGIRPAHRWQPRKANQQYAVRGAAQTEDKLAEVLVGSYQDALISVGQLEDGIVGDPRRELGDVDDLVASRAQPGNDRRVDALVGEQLHATDLATG